MSKKIPILKPEKIIRVLKRNGFKRKKRSSGHAVFHHDDGRYVSVPVHGKRDIGKGLFDKILNSSKKQIKEFL